MLIALTLDPYVQEWLDLLLRWLHVIAAIGWIGSSFYFVLLDQSLRRPADPADEQSGVGGELWEVHGGGFYHVQKYKVAPPSLPDHLAWFKWEAYATWLSGFALLVVLYWMDARTYMIDESVADLSPGMAVAVSAGLIAGAWVIYDVLCRVVRNERVLWLFLVAGIAVAAWGTGELFAPRAAWLQVGAMLGTIMAGSVLFNIIPAHRELIRAKEAGRDPDPAPGIEAKRRSVHNNYFTLPVLVTMLAGHFAFLTGRDNAWLILLALMAIGAFVRHFYNLRHAGRTHWWMPAAAAAGVAALAIGLWPSDAEEKDVVEAAPGAPPGKALFEEVGCAECHALDDAGAEGTSGPDLDEAQPPAALVIDRVTHGAGGMPPFNGRLDEGEISAIADYVVEATGGGIEAE